MLALCAWLPNVYACMYELVHVRARVYMMDVSVQVCVRGNFQRCMHRHTAHASTCGVDACTVVQKRTRMAHMHVHFTCTNIYNPHTYNQTCTCTHPLIYIHCRCTYTYIYNPHTHPHTYIYNPHTHPHTYIHCTCTHVHVHSHCVHVHTPPLYSCIHNTRAHHTTTQNYTRSPPAQNPLGTYQPTPPPTPLQTKAGQKPTTHKLKT